MKYSALIGNPVEHSVSPQLFEILSKKIDLDYSHIKILVEKKEDLEEKIKALCKLDFIGFNITCPYKIDVFSLLKHENCSEEILKINSINTVKIKNGKIFGYNTDGKAAIQAIRHFYDIKAKDKVVLLGAGGVAHPILYELLKITPNIVVFNENLENAKKMCSLFSKNISSYSLKDENTLYKEIEDASIIINATSVGMYPNNNLSLIDMNKIKNKKCFFDVVFNPWETLMLTEAANDGHIIISGGYMLIYQAILALELWLDKKIELSKGEIEEISLKMIETLRNNYD